MLRQLLAQLFRIEAGEHQLCGWKNDMARQHVEGAVPGGRASGLASITAIAAAGSATVGNSEGRSSHVHTIYAFRSSEIAPASPACLTAQPRHRPEGVRDVWCWAIIRGQPHLAGFVRSERRSDVTAIPFRCSEPIV
jgi:hypothetical protein